MNRNVTVVSILAGLLLLGAITFGINERNEKEGYKTALNNDYQRLFYDTKAHIENVEVSLSKAVVSDSKEQNVLNLSEIYQQAQSAQEKLTQMPVSHSEISKTTKYLTQVSDYCYSLIKENLDGKEISKEQRGSLKELGDYANRLNKELGELHDKFIKGDFTFETVKAQQKKNMDNMDNNMLNTSLVKLQETSTKYPELIYDGPFSDQARNIKAKGLGSKKVTKEEAIKIAKDFVGTKNSAKVTKFEAGNDLDKEAAIPSYTFSIEPANKKNENAIYIAVSKQGGDVVWMANPRNVAETKLKVEEASKKAKEFLEKKGFKNMEINYSQTHHNVITLNYAYTQENVTIYPDLIKVKVALDNGEIVGYDALHYLKEHHKRDIQKPSITIEEARKKVRYEFDITNSRLAIIPIGIKSEALCYEFKGNYDGDNFIVYINAHTGKEEQILRVITNENGTLTF